jgi:acyl-CoA dehydrogenase
MVTDLSVAILGGGLKTKQHITGRLADALSDLYFLCCMLKRFDDDAEPQADRGILDYCAQNALARFYASLSRVIDNFPNVPVALLMRIAVFPFGNRTRPARDRMAKAMMSLILQPTATRDRLTREIFVSQDPNDATGVLEAAFLKVIETDEASHKLERAVRQGAVRRFLGNDFITEAVQKGVVTPEEGESLRERERLVAKVIAVDHFDPDEITGNSAIGHNSRPASAFDKPPHASGDGIQAAE